MARDTRHGNRDERDRSAVMRRDSRAVVTRLATIGRKGSMPLSPISRRRRRIAVATVSATVACDGTEPSIEGNPKGTLCEAKFPVSVRLRSQSEQVIATER